MEVHDVEPLLSYREATEYLLQNHGRAASYSTLRRWHARGCRESRGVRLEATRFGGRWMTRGSWLDAFICACNPAPASVKPTRQIIDPNMFRQEEACRQRLIALGFGGTGRRRGRPPVGKRL